MMCGSMLAAARHASLVRLCFSFAHPATECALMVLQLSQALRRLRRGSVLKLVSERSVVSALQEARGRAPFQSSRQHWRRVGCEGLGGWSCALGSCRSYMLWYFQM